MHSAAMYRFAQRRSAPRQLHPTGEPHSGPSRVADQRAELRLCTPVGALLESKWGTSLYRIVLVIGIISDERVGASSARTLHEQSRALSLLRSSDSCRIRAISSSYPLHVPYRIGKRGTAFRRRGSVQHRRASVAA